MKFLFFFLLFIPFTQASAGAGTIMDIMYPSINFLLFFGFLVFKLKKSISESFDTKADEVKEQYEFADVKNKESDIKLKMYEDKLNNLNTEETKIRENAQEDAERFLEENTEEKNKNVERVKKDSINTLESEKNQMVKEINSELLDLILSKTKKQIGSDNDLRSKVTTKLLSEI